MRTIFLVPVGLVLGMASASAGPCPATISVNERPAGSAAAAVLVEHPFRYVSFYEGNPKDQADLAPDEGPDPKKLEQHWELTRTPGQSITMVCRYHGTDKTVVDVVPPGIKGCTLTGEMDAHGEVIGSPTLECK
jgi:hypothetical protein